MKPEIVLFKDICKGDVKQWLCCLTMEADTQIDSRRCGDIFYRYTTVFYRIDMLIRGLDYNTTEKLFKVVLKLTDSHELSKTEPCGFREHFR